MSKLEDKDRETVKSLEDEDIEGVSGGAGHSKKIFGPKPVLDHPIICAKYGGPKPTAYTMYGGAMPKVPRIVPTSSEDTDKETKK